MIKRMVLYAISRQTDSDAFWQYHTQEHAPAVLQVCGDRLVKYAINRVIDLTKGTTRYFGVEETWWRDRSAMQTGFQALESQVLPNGKREMNKSNRLRLKSKNSWRKSIPGNCGLHLPNTWVSIPCPRGLIRTNSGSITHVSMPYTVSIPLTTTSNITSSTG